MMMINIIMLVVIVISKGCGGLLRILERESVRVLK